MLKRVLSVIEALVERSHLEKLKEFDITGTEEVSDGGCIGKGM